MTNQLTLLNSRNVAICAMIPTTVNISHNYSDEGYPLKHFCTLYKSCEETIECRGCVSETKDCFRGCSKHIIGCELATKAFLDDKQNI